MSWTARVRDNAQCRMKKSPASTLPWTNLAATATGHFRPAYGANEHLSTNDHGGLSRNSQPSPKLDDRPPLAEWKDALVASTTTSSTNIAATSTAGDQTDALAWMNAEDMDPFVAHEREAMTALQGIRRNMDRFLNEELRQLIYVKIPAAPPLLSNPQLNAPTPAELEEAAQAAQNSKKPPKPSKGVSSPKPGAETPSGPPPGSGVAACNALIATKLVCSDARSMPLATAQMLLQHVEEVISSGYIKVPRADGENGTQSHNATMSRSKAATPQPSTARHKGKGGAMTPGEPVMDDGVRLVPVPDAFLPDLKVYVKDMEQSVQLYDRGIALLAAAYPLASTAPSQGLPPLGQQKVQPAQLSKGLSMAARELALQHSDVPGHHDRKGNASIRRSAHAEVYSVEQQHLDAFDAAAQGSPLSDPNVVASTTSAPSCGEFVTGRTATTFGRCDVANLSARVICGHWSPRDTIVLWVLRCLQDCSVIASEGTEQSAKALLPLLPQRVSIGIGWQKHPVFGAVTVCLATPTFDELTFTNQRSLLPINEIARRVTNGQACRADLTQFPIQFVPSMATMSSASTTTTTTTTTATATPLLAHYSEFKSIRAVSPATHPIEPISSSEVQLLLDVPLTVDIACTVVQVDAPPQTPFYGRKLVDAEMRIARRKGKPLATVSQEPRCSTSSCLVDFPPSALGTATRITVRLVSHRHATLHIFAKLNSQPDAVFHKVSSVGIHPLYTEEAWLAAQGVASNPLHTVGLPVTSDMFQRWRGCIAAPLCETIIDGATNVPFEVYLPGDIKSCVLKGAHGELALHPVAAPQLPTSSSTALNVSLEAMSPIPLDSDASVPEASLQLPLMPTSRSPASKLFAGAHVKRDSEGSSAGSIGSQWKRRGRGSKTSAALFRGVLTRAKEGPLQMWADGFVVCQWTVAY